MSIVTLTPSAYFYAIASIKLNHAHALPLTTLRFAPDHVVCDLEGFEVPNKILDVEVIHKLHLLQSKHYHDTEKPHIGGLCGWEMKSVINVSGQQVVYYKHTTATGRMRMWVKQGSEEEFGIEVFGGDEISCGELTWSKPINSSFSHWRIRCALPQNDMAIRWAERPDRWFGVFELFYHIPKLRFDEATSAWIQQEGEAVNAFPGDDLRSADGFMLSAWDKLVECCLNNSCWEIAREAKGKAKPELQPFPVDPELADLIQATE